MKIHPSLLLFFLCTIAGATLHAQPVTGYWKGKIDRRKVEVKIIKNGDSLTGTSYYYQSPNNYKRYSIKGYLDDRDNSVVWWDDQLIEEKGGNGLFSKKPAQYIYTTDFNCPGGTKMFLEGNAALKDNNEEQNRPVALEKKAAPVFSDEWDYVIDNYTVGGYDPELIDSISQVAFNNPVPEAPPVTIETKPAPKPTVVTAAPKKDIPVPVVTKEPPVRIEPVKEPVVIAPLTNEEKFTRRSKRLMQEITISGDSIELRFYDNAEIDGDSIAIFLNNVKLYEHIRLTDKAYTIKLAVAALQQTNELVMVAENLGSIPPNTSLMVADINGQRYEARLESTEGSSALIRFVKK